MYSDTWKISNNITINTETHDEIEKHQIELALVNNWFVDDECIHVEVTGPRVKLIGMAHSAFQKNEAERTTWNVEGVWAVENELTIEVRDQRPF